MTVFAWILVALGVLVLVLTPLRLRRSTGERGMTDFSGWVLNAHSVSYTHLTLPTNREV